MITFDLLSDKTSVAFNIFVHRKSWLETAKKAQILRPAADVDGNNALWSFVVLLPRITTTKYL